AVRAGPGGPADPAGRGQDRPPAVPRRRGRTRRLEHAQAERAGSLLVHHKCARASSSPAPGAMRTTTMSHRGGRDHYRVTLPWFGAVDPRCCCERRGPWGYDGRATNRADVTLSRFYAARCHIAPVADGAG